jgi:hypothetical protein
MKQKLIFISVLFILIIFMFAGCRDLRGATSNINSAASGLTGTVSGAVSKVESEGAVIGSAISGTVSGVTSAITSSK